MDPLTAHKTWRTLEPVHGLVYFAPEAHAAYHDLGLDPMQGYFASRSAAMGVVPAGVVIATFFNFKPELVRAAVPGAWNITTPDALAAARTQAAGAALERVLGADVTGSRDMEEAADLAKQAAIAAGPHVEGRPLFAAHAALDWPEAPHLVLWHAQMLLREYRGDGHIALLAGHGLTPLDALILHVATGEVTRAGIQATRGWTDDEWEAGIGAAAAKGLVDDSGAFTGAGRTLRADIEARTDELATIPYDALGADACTRLREIVRPWSRTLMSALGR